MILKVTDNKYGRLS